MNPVQSLRGLCRTLAADVRLVGRGTTPGWYTLNHYRGRWQARARAAATVTTTAVRVNGRAVRVFVTPQHLGTMLGVFLDAEYDLRAALPDFRPKTVLDLGANAGMATAYLHAFYPDAEFVCVEPDPRNVPLLERTLAANGIRATVVPAAVAAAAGEMALRFGDNPTCSALESSPLHDLTGGVRVKLTTVPDLMSSAGWERIDLLKVDIEGTEAELLARDNGWLERVGVIVMEIHPNTSEAEIGGFLTPFGFRLSRLAHGREPVFLAHRP